MERSYSDDLRVRCVNIMYEEQRMAHFYFIRFSPCKGTSSTMQRCFRKVLIIVTQRSSIADILAASNINLLLWTVYLFTIMLLFIQKQQEKREI
ncbi:hypothetical protein RO3G_08476 [Rhizopus delemar RA 99-880]|uniref:Uncharacterized protein n=1 Tax=Rhizopus delemar (strain RA 99-880 / ATCC MYA-4621 / FGSC 9543 / NRRL 43880) TaxID=246409 RepID=I1C5P1_RHIO9|nr:hypothetical protein RO3G_08476 [Rhizopus delemar RA 99-880]|eukprot:EIE83771.1 hypothetical protein RO3G_08476 [Rhizopus delemar RA 99-880]